MSNKKSKSLIANPSIAALRRLILRAKYKSSGGIYKIVCSVNGREYVGHSNCLERRRLIHFFDLLHKTHHNDRLQLDYDLFGPDAFEFVVLFSAPPFTKEVTLRLLEQENINRLNPYYNIERIVVRPSAKVVSGVKYLPCKEPQRHPYKAKEIKKKKPKKHKPRNKKRNPELTQLNAAHDAVNLAWRERNLLKGN